MSDKEYDVTIHARNIKLDVVIPQKWVWSFMNQFGKKFAVTDSYHGVKKIKTVDGYHGYCHDEDTWHIQVTVWETKEKEFYEFLQRFCKRRKISFRDPREDEEFLERQKILFESLAKNKPTQHYPKFLEPYDTIT